MGPCWPVRRLLCGLHDARETFQQASQPFDLEGATGTEPPLPVALAKAGRWDLLKALLDDTPHSSFKIQESKIVYEVEAKNEHLRKLMESDKDPYKFAQIIRQPEFTMYGVLAMLLRGALKCVLLSGCCWASFPIVDYKIW